MKTALLALAALCATPVAAQNDISVVVVDIQARHLEFDDPNVRIVDLTPALSEGQSHDQDKLVGDFSHGDIVASSFVKRYRDIDPSAHITIYSIDPFVVHKGEQAMRFDLGMLREGLAKLNDPAAHIAITAFGAASPTAGDRIASAFSAAGLVLFASIPNDMDDPGIYPSATPGVISVGNESTGITFSDKPAMATWVNFLTVGDYRAHQRDRQIKGSSFSVGYVAAYGAYISSHEPHATSARIRDVIASAGRPIKGTVRGKPIVTVHVVPGTADQTILAAYSTPTQVAAR